MKITYFQIEDADLATVKALFTFVDGKQQSPEALMAIINGQRKQDASGPPNHSANKPAEPQAAAEDETDKPLTSQAKFDDATMYPSNPDEIVILDEELLPVEMEVEVASLPEIKNNVLPKYKNSCIPESPLIEIFDLADIASATSDDDELVIPLVEEKEEITASSDSE